jgi:phage terminase large subunit-like protein
VKAGPKGSRDESPLAWKTRAKGARQFELFAARYLITPKGTGARTPVKVRPWQRQLVSTLLDDRVPLNVWVLPRGQGKSTLTAGLALHHVFMSGVEGARAVIVAQDERSAMRLLATAARMVSLNPELESRAMTYKDRIVIPGSDSQIIALPGSR